MLPIEVPLPATFSRRNPVIDIPSSPSNTYSSPKSKRSPSKSVRIQSILSSVDFVENNKNNVGNYSKSSDKTVEIESSPRKNFLQKLQDSGKIENREASLIQLENEIKLKKLESAKLDQEIEKAKKLLGEVSMEVTKKSAEMKKQKVKLLNNMRMLRRHLEKDSNDKV